MTPLEFCHWMHGFLSGAHTDDVSQYSKNCIRDQLKKVFAAEKDVAVKFEAVTPPHLKAKYMEPYSHDADKVAQDFP